MTSTRLTVSFLGLGEMGSVLARTAMNAGHETLVWNRTAARAAALVAEGATAAAHPAQALDADLIVVCLFDQASVHEVLDSVADQLAGRRMVNLTTTSPNGARELARWAAGHGADYLDGGIMATPEMIATPQSAILYSGSAAVFERYRELFELWGGTEYFGDDAGLASLYDLALLSAMYVMFAGFAHGAAMVGAAGVSAKEFATRTAAWLPALMPAIAEYATVIDGGDYSVPGQQSLYFSDLTDIVNASRDQGISTEVVDMVQRLIHRQIDAGHGDDGFARIIESIKNGAAA
ncbi:MULTISPECIES: NAD(P)-dependent oxidoreductase [Mycolicibacterium]|uniref:6-phosphogluconate dehydrogenase n=1 Tax=Mycolicibacterium senegalense TaxID=1796 RepID=A0A378W7Z1_9MYCO|nr:MULTISPECIES: NAD(P)-binding domain-containing protein [Mycolicibacterium]MCV7337331.1 NAD(P)-dependent oxidoreductase [Mycolicibacterium senegalense]MDR7287170.1 3-hydroxyisobutyrate dehydrogenase-like beta-hydroxyacid dehydrogenase [Mycolicibacterium senegalense]QZA24270.1 NAD(P)-binding domain-containing protein [Mycolicibacterium senegalense]CDP87811.1 oxidoreductase [Mycolicibacterium farcinogenes]SUA29253.1 6-phosphogluconate dehydrogenase [Mycolicibacterium senegalense]